MMDKLKKMGAYTTPVLLALSVLADITGALPSINPIVKIVMMISAIIVFVYAVYFFIEQKKQNNILTAIDCLEREICEGKKIITNNVKVTFDLQNHQYLLEFEKQFEMLTAAHPWFSAQFYCNKNLEDSIESEKYYEENPVDWDVLDINAQLSYKNKGDEAFTENFDVAVLHVAQGNNFKQFHIQFKERESGVSLNIENGAIIKLTYRYKAPIKIWGSYINRTISYFAESARVKFLCSNRNKLSNCGLKLCILDPITGEPKLIKQNLTFDREGSTHTCTIDLPPRRFGRYRITWVSESLFGQEEQSTKNTADASQLTKY